MMSAAAEPHVEPVPSFSTELRALAAGAAAGGSLRTVFESLKGRGFGLVVLLLGVLLLVPIDLVLPQIVGVLLLIAGWGILWGAAAPWLAFQGSRPLSGSQLNAIAEFIHVRCGWIESIVKPRFSDLAGDFAERAAGVGILLAGICALAPIPHALAALGLILLGLGLMERDGIATLAACPTFPVVPIGRYAERWRRVSMKLTQTN
jgi:hypothetical protein